MSFEVWPGVIVTAVHRAIPDLFTGHGMISLAAEEGIDSCLIFKSDRNVIKVQI